MNGVSHYTCLIPHLCSMQGQGTLNKWLLQSLISLAFTQNHILSSVVTSRRTMLHFREKKTRTSRKKSEPSVSVSLVTVLNKTIAHLLYPYSSAAPVHHASAGALSTRPPCVRIHPLSSFSLCRARLPACSALRHHSLLCAAPASSALFFHPAPAPLPGSFFYSPMSQKPSNSFSIFNFYSAARPRRPASFPAAAGWAGVVLPLAASSSQSPRASSS